MGKRRIRNLKSLGIDSIVGIDTREDRRAEATSLYNITTYSSLSSALGELKFHCWFISVPPDLHHGYIREALRQNIPCFVEASVLDTDFDYIVKESSEKGVLVAPSCTLRFHPAIKKIYELIKDREIGDITNVIYHSGQFLPDWHSFESVSDYYVSNPATGGAREIVPFEMTWISDLFGFPQRVACLFKKTMQIEGAEGIDDTYNLLMDYEDFIINLTVDVVSRCATRRLTINGTQKQLFWNWEENGVKVYDPKENVWVEHGYATLPAQSGYNKNITEQMYIEEVQHFLRAVEGVAVFPNSIENDWKVLRLLYAAEASSQSGSFKSIK
jgi:predicted dehydrogenase